jgi:hypothetical protein
MGKSRVGLAAALSAMVTLTACSSFTASGDPLNETEAGELAGMMVGQGFPGTGGVGAGAPTAPGGVAASPNAPAVKVTVKVDDSAPCQGGGTVALAGSLTMDVNEIAKTGSVEYSFTLTPTGCKATTQAGKTFTLNGDPNLKGEGKLDWQATSIGGAIKYSGKFKWEASDGRTGVCGVDLTGDFNLSTTDVGGNASANLTGTVCGINVNRNVTVQA